jgi:hypothetical protein
MLKNLHHFLIQVGFMLFYVYHVEVVETPMALLVNAACHSHVLDIPAGDHGFPRASGNTVTWLKTSVPVQSLSKQHERAVILFHSLLLVKEMWHMKLNITLYAILYLRLLEYHNLMFTFVTFWRKIVKCYH